MNPEKLEQLKYPIGKFDWEANRSPEVLQKAIIKIKNFPKKLKETTAPLPPATLLHRYRP